MGARPTRRLSLQPEATGAGMEETKCLSLWLARLRQAASSPAAIGCQRRTVYELARHPRGCVPPQAR